MDRKLGVNVSGNDLNLRDYIDEDYAHSQAVLKANVVLIKLLIQALVDFPMSVRVTPISGEQTAVFEILVAQEDVKRIIGRKGRIADALREILLSLGAKAKTRYILEILEPKGK